jgi:hypothetical protein
MGLRRDRDATLPRDERLGAARLQIAVIDIAHVVIRRTAQHDCGNRNDTSHSTQSTDFTDERRKPPSPITSKEDLEARSDRAVRRWRVTSPDSSS